MRNDVSHFSVNPTNLDIGRSRFPRPFNHKFTGNVGDLIPFYWSEILPGDTVSMNVSKVVRQSTLLDPVMDNLYLDTYFFFVPMRLVFDKYREFFGENTSGPWAPSTSYTIPRVTTTSERMVQPQSVADYMGVPVGIPNLSFNWLPIRSYVKVYMDWFMDQMTMTPPSLYTGPNDANFAYATEYGGGNVYKACKFHDYFSSSTPAPQRGPAVTVPLSGTIPVDLSGSVGNIVGASTMHAGGTYGYRFGATASDSASYLTREGLIDGKANLLIGTAAATASDTPVNYSNLTVEWPENATLDLSGASPINVNDLRLAFQMQKWYEKSALYGGRYIEMLKAQFGVTSPDARLQRSEYLGGNRVPLNVTQVENQSTGTGSQPLGHLGAFSATSDFDECFTHSFTEHGFLLGICVCRYKHTYSQGLERSWSRRTMFDYYFPVFANIGNQPVLKKEIYAQGTSADDNVWGYQEAWADYRYHPDRVSGYMRPGISGSLASWHYADYYASEPFLSESWMKEDKSMVDRTLAVTSSSAPQLIFDFLCDATFVRAMPLYSVPGLIDHH